MLGLVVPTQQINHNKRGMQGVELKAKQPSNMEL